jgi:hypothetical protein
MTARHEPHQGAPARWETRCRAISVPQKSHRSGSPTLIPQDSHGRNGIPRHPAVRLLKWFCEPLASLYVGERLTMSTAEGEPDQAPNFC